MELSVQQVEPLVALIVGPNAADAASSMRALATMHLSSDAWHVVDAAVRGRLAAEEVEPSVVAAAAHVPLAGIRDLLRTMACDPTDPRRDAAARGLIEVGDERALVAEAMRLAEDHEWSRVMMLEPGHLVDLPESIWQHGDDADIFHVVAAGKAGRLGPLRRFLDRIERGEVPELFDGNPMYIASLLTPALPVPAVFERAVRAAWQRQMHDSPGGAASDELRRVLNVLAEGLLGESVY